MAGGRYIMVPLEDTTGTITVNVVMLYYIIHTRAETMCTCTVLLLKLATVKYENSSTLMVWPSSGIYLSEKPQAIYLKQSIK